MSPFEAYNTYQSLRQHFSKWTYDCFRYNFKTNCRVDSFEKRRDKYQFGKLARVPDLTNFMVANIMERDLSWVGDLMSDQAEETYLAWVRRQQSMTYLFTDQVGRLLDDFNENFIVRDGQYPHLYRLYRQGDVSPETVLILEELVRFFPHWKKNVKDQTIWPNDHLKLVKYRPFIKYDVNKCRQILLSTVDRV